MHPVTVTFKIFIPKNKEVLKEIKSLYTELLNEKEKTIAFLKKEIESLKKEK